MNLQPMGPAALSVPGKTFLVGEYLALEGGPSIILTTEPRFQLKVDLRTYEGAEGFNFSPQSPAGRLLQRFPQSVREYRFEFEDPHEGRGGLGASSAQFVLVYAWLFGLESLQDIERLLLLYRECAWKGEGTPPSGADVVAQVTGGVTWFDGLRFEACDWRWPFSDLGFSLLRTGSKLATHEHLQRVTSGAAVPAEALRTQVAAAGRAFGNSDERALVEAVANVGLILEEAGLCTSHTRQILDELRRQCDWSLAAKGCGAMGADVILVLHEKAKAPQVAEWGRARGLEGCGTDRDLATGIRVEG